MSPLMLGADGKLLRNGNRLVLASGPCCCDGTGGGGGMDDCDRRLFVTWTSEALNGDPIILVDSTVFTRMVTVDDDNGDSFEITLDAELIGPECIPLDFNGDITLALRYTLNSNPPLAGDGMQELTLTATSFTDYSGSASVGLIQVNFPSTPFGFTVEYDYVRT